MQATQGARASLPRPSQATLETKDTKGPQKKSLDKGSSTQIIKGKTKKLVVGASKKRGSGDGKDGLHADGFDAAAADALFDKLREAEKVQKALRKASGGEALEHNRIGPDVVYEFTERTPISLWMNKDPLIDYAVVMEKESTDVIPVSPRPEESLKDGKSTTMLFQQQPKSPAMTWNANLTELEEEEFGAEAAFINDNFKLAYCLPLEEANIFKNEIQHVRIYNPDGTMEEKDRVRVSLSETTTTFYVQINGRTRPDDGEEETEKVKLRNENYRKVCQHHLESDAYYDRPTQTFLDRERDKSTQLVGIGVVDEEQVVNNYMILDELASIKESDAKKKLKDEEDAIMKSLTDRAHEEVDKNEYKGSSSEDESDEEDRAFAVSTVDWNRIEEYFDEDDVEPPDEVLEEDIAISDEDEFDIEIDLDEIYAKRRRKLKKHRPKVLPDITYSALVLERISSTIRFHKPHMDIRGFHPLIKKDDGRRLHYTARNMALLDLGPKLKRFWSFKPNVTKGKEVTCIAPHPTNGNLIAASYGSNDYTSPPEGFVCIWNIKNINYPERVWKFESSVTVLAFSQLTPYLLAIGLLDGNIFVYDLRSAKPKAFCTTITSVDKHFGPVWDLFWLLETEKASSGAVNEVLVSVSDDGFSYKWGSSKGFEPWVLLKARRCPLKIPGRREKRAEALISQLSAAFTICFYPDDETLYLIGTEEGFIHKCTTSIAEQFITTYVSHTGPVYRIKFSPFARDIFISCGGDWCIKIWKEDQPAPIVTLWSDLRTVFDIMWCPHMSTVFVCTSELYIEVWDLKSSPTEPIIQFHPPGLGLRSVSYSEYIQALIIGDDDGGMTVFAFKNFPIQPIGFEEQADQLYDALIPGYSRRKNRKAARSDEASKRRSFNVKREASLHPPAHEQTTASPRKSLLTVPGVVPSMTEGERSASNDETKGSIKPAGSGNISLTVPTLAPPTPA